MLLELALAALDELVKMAHMNLSLWNPSMDGGDERLNYEEYRQVFSHCTGMKQAGFASEATREIGMVMINSSARVESLVDVVRLADMFPGMIARATTMNVISRGMDGTRNRALQLHKLIEKCTLGASKMLPKIKKARQMRVTMAANAQNQHSGTTLVAGSPVAQGRCHGDTVSSKPQKYNVLNEMEDLTARICWELVKKEGYVAIWRKPLNTTCYINRDSRAQPPLCDAEDDPNSVWYDNLKACISLLPENGYAGNLTS